MNYTVLVLPEAEQDAHRIYRWIAERSPRGADRWYEQNYPERSRAGFPTKGWVGRKAPAGIFRRLPRRLEHHGNAARGREVHDGPPSRPEVR